LAIRRKPIRALWVRSTPAGRCRIPFHPGRGSR
jgi:hypothetical protein